MRRSRPSLSGSPYRPLGVHASQGAQKIQQSVSSLLRSYNFETNPTRPVRPSPLTASTIPDMPLDLLDRIRSFPLFMSAPDEFLAAIGRHLRPQIHASQDHILTEGDEAKAMYWLVRGVVAVTSRDGEAVYAELKPGAFFGEIGVLMNVPRTATIVARTKCLLVVLKKEDLQAELPIFPEMEKAIRHEAQERLTILKKKRQESGHATRLPEPSHAREAVPGEVSTGEVGIIKQGVVVNTKKRKSPSPGMMEDPAVGGSALGSGIVNVRTTLKELPLFSTLPPDILHFLGLSAQPKSYAPFNDIVRQGTQGNDIYFIVKGEAEVIHKPVDCGKPRRLARSSYLRPRLKAGQYFGEVASLGFSEGRTATVRSITTVECLMIGGEALKELWKRCPPEIKLQVEETARTRYWNANDEDVEMADAETTSLSGGEGGTPSKLGLLPQGAFSMSSKPASPTQEEHEQHQHPSDPDPYLSIDMENLRSRRRSSFAPPTPSTEFAQTAVLGVNGVKPHALEGSPLKFSATAPTDQPSPPEENPPIPAKRARTLARRPRSLSIHELAKPTLPDDVLIVIFRQFDLLEMIRLRVVCSRWRRLLCESPKLCTHLDLQPFNRKVTDWSLVHILAPFIGQRPIQVDISNCFHITDEGFRALWRSCGKKVKCWKMRSVWDVAAAQILEMSDNAKELEEVDWSNCRKVGDPLLARVVGWIVPEAAPLVREANAGNSGLGLSPGASSASAQASKGQRAHPESDRRTEAAVKSGSTQSRPAPPPPQMLPPGTVIGCPKLRRLNLSYCKHITDRSMAHLAAHASNRLESLELTRCTSITDAGFQSWAPFHFQSLTRLGLADCTYLSDHSIIALVNAAKSLTHLDLSFCCALSDTATEVVALGLPVLRELRLAFCGSAVSDASLGCIALHLNELRGLSVRGCVRVTGVGVENVLEGCDRLEWLDVSQCKNLAGWLMGGGLAHWGYDERDEGKMEKEDRTEELADKKEKGEKDEEDGGSGTGVWHASNGEMDVEGEVIGQADATQKEARAPATSPLLQRSARGGHGYPAAPVLSGRYTMAVPRPVTAKGGGPRPVDLGTVNIATFPHHAAHTLMGPGHGPIMRRVIPPKGATTRRNRKPVRFIVEKGEGGLR